VNTLLDFCKRGHGSGLQETKEEKRFKPHRQAWKHQPENFKCNGKRGSDSKPVKFSTCFCISQAQMDEQRFCFGPVSRHLLSTQHTVKILCQILLFWVPLDLLQCLILLRYENCCLLLSSRISCKSLKVCLNM
jgi:hypothetical protein